MSALPGTMVSAARDWRSGWHDRWRQADPRTRTRIQVAVFLVVVIYAYHYSLSTLIQSLNVDTPLAYVGLVPFIALGLAAVRSRPLASEPAIHDRQVDYIVGLPLVIAAIAINIVLPRRLSAMFWVWRIDLLSLPFFVAGVATIIFGVRAVWRQRLAVAYLFLAWPLPYSVLLLRDLNSFTNLTLAALRSVTSVVHFARVLPGAGGSVFNIVHHGAAFQISVVSACSGVNGMVGFLLVGAAFGAIVTGPRLRKSIWLAGGLLLLWSINILRILLIFWAGQVFGEHFAIKVLHPYVGLLTFNIGVVVMLLLLGPAGLRIGRSPRIPKASRLVPPNPPGSPGSPLAVPAVYSAVALVVIASLLVGVRNSGLRAYDLVAQASGEPKLASYLAYPGAPPGWQATFTTQYDWAKPYFGESSSWYRYAYSESVGPTNLHASLPVIADVINTNSLASFSAYGVEACYRFHGYKLHDVSAVGLGGGITGQALSYTTTSGTSQNWSILYWIWPVTNGTSTRYERIILYILDVDSATVSAPGVTGITNLQGSLSPADANQRRLITLRGFLVAFARDIVQAQAKIPVGSKLVDSRANLQPPNPALLAQRRQELRNKAKAAAGTTATTPTTVVRAKP